MAKTKPIYIPVYGLFANHFCNGWLKLEVENKKYVNYLELTASVNRHLETIAKVPLDTITDIQYKKPFLFGDCELHIIENTHNPILAALTVPRDGFFKSDIEKLKRIILG